MKNKTLAIFGIGTYILSVLSSAENSKGNSIAPIALLAISVISSVVFYIMAIVRLWKNARGVSIMLALSSIIVFILYVIQGVSLPSYGSPIIILLNVAKVIDLIVFIWAISLLWSMAKYEGLSRGL